MTPSQHNKLEFEQLQATCIFQKEAIRQLNADLNSLRNAIEEFLSTTNAIIMMEGTEIIREELITRYTKLRELLSNLTLKEAIRTAFSETPKE